MHINNYDCIYSCYRICVSFRLNDSQYGELLLQFEHCRKDKMSDNHSCYDSCDTGRVEINDNENGKLLLQLTLGKMKWMTISIDNFYYICDTGHDEINDNE